jgi:hypothetical protein
MNSRVAGSFVIGFKVGGSGSGKSAWMLYHLVGMSFWSKNHIALSIFPPFDFLFGYHSELS